MNVKLWDFQIVTKMLDVLIHLVVFNAFVKTVLLAMEKPANVSLLYCNLCKEIRYTI